MKQLFLLLILVNSILSTFAQSTEYSQKISEALVFYKSKEFLKSAQKYSEAFQANNWKGVPIDRYNSACSWALAGQPDSAFYQLNKVLKAPFYYDLSIMNDDEDLIPLRSDPRWSEIKVKFEEKKQLAEAKMNKPIKRILDSINNEDQYYRKQSDEIYTKFGQQSVEFIELWKKINYRDSLNLIEVKKILKTYGWLSSDEVGNSGNSTLFLVIQHSDLKTQEQYLPMMREAVKNGKAQGSQLALLEDRVLMGNKKPQIYGSQVRRNPDNGKSYIVALIDPDKVDERRASVGLGPISDYAKHFDIDWNLEEYKKELPELMKKL